MKTVSSLFIFFFILPTYACRLNTELVSLSGPVTMLLEELELLNDLKLMAISAYHPVSKKFNIKKLPGGIFLGKKVLGEFDPNTVVIFDQSFELKKSLNYYFKKKIIEVDTRGVDPFVAYDRSKKKLLPYLINCELRLRKIDKDVAAIKAIDVHFQKNETYLFYLGELSLSKKKPELLMVNDGPIKWLVNFKVLKTYPSDLAYVTWSKKILKKIKSKKEFGLLNGTTDTLKVVKVLDSQFNLYYRGLLIPGLRQVYFLKDFLNYLGK